MSKCFGKMLSFLRSLVDVSCCVFGNDSPIIDEDYTSLSPNAYLLSEAILVQDEEIFENSIQNTLPTLRTHISLYPSLLFPTHNPQQ